MRQGVGGANEVEEATQTDALWRDFSRKGASQNRHCGRGAEGQAVHSLVFPVFCLSLVEVCPMLLPSNAAGTPRAATGEAGTLVGTVPSRQRGAGPSLFGHCCVSQSSQVCGGQDGANSVPSLPQQWHEQCPCEGTRGDLASDTVVTLMLLSATDRKCQNSLSLEEQHCFL